MERMHVRHTGKREMFTSGAPQRRQSEGKNAAKRPHEIVEIAESAQSSRRRTSNRPKRPSLAPGDVPAAARIMSPVLLKTCLPRPAHAWAPAGRIVFSISRRNGTSNRLPLQMPFRVPEIFDRAIRAVTIPKLCESHPPPRRGCRHKLRGTNLSQLTSVLG